MIDLLLRIDEDSGYSHLLLDREIKSRKIATKDIGLLTEVVYGTIQRKITLDYYLSPFLTRKIEQWVQMLLRMSVYQMEYLDRVPDHAIVHEAVEIAKQRGHKGIASLVNGVLRNIQRKGVPDTSKISNKVKRLSIETSHPEWLVERWISQYGYKVTKAMCEANIKQKPIAVRIQPLKISREKAMQELKEEGYEVSTSFFSDQGIMIEQGNILHSRLFKEGFVTIQDQSSMLASEMLNTQPDMQILDACSAPGGKVTHLAELMENKGTIDAYDLHKNKLKLIERKSNELDITIINTAQADARNLHELIEHETYDRIMVDAPCSGLGVIRSKPDIKYNKSIDDIHRLATIQLNILTSIAPLLKKDGLLIYSTCTVDKEENEEVVKKFLKKHPHIKIDEHFFNELPTKFKKTSGISKYGIQLFPQSFQTNGFFIARFIKKR